MLFVSRVVPHKGHKHVLSVAAEVQHQTGRPVHVTFVGSCEDRLKTYWTGLETIAENLQLRLTLTGVVSDEDLLKIYHGSDVFVCLSEHEGFGMPVFEAMRCHVPVVAWASSAFTDLLQDHPLVSPVFDIPRFAAAVLAALQPDNRKRVIELQMRLLTAYTKETVESQLRNAILPADARRSRHSPAQLKSSGLAAVLASVEAYYSKINSNADRSRQSFQHDSSVNYVSQYDLDAYRELLSLRRRNPGEHAAAGGSSASTESYPDLERLKAFVFGPVERAVEEIRSVKELLDLNDSLFIEAAYLIVLGRKVDESGRRTYLRKLRAGVGKGSILLWLSESDEGRAHAADLPGLEEYLIKQASSSSTGGLSKFFRAGRLNHDLVEAQREFGRLVRNVGILQTAKGRGAPDNRLTHIDDLCELEGSEFVDMAYLALLGRKGDAGGHQHYVRELANGTSKADIIKALAESDEGKAFDSDMEGLHEFLSSRKKANHWLWGNLTADVRARVQVRRLINGLGYINQYLIASPIDAVNREPSQNALFSQQSPVDAVRERPSPITLLRERAKAPSHLTSPACIVSLAPTAVEVGGSAPAIRHVHQILINDSGSIPKELPFVVSENIESIKRHHPQAEYHLWDRTELRAFIAEKFTTDVLTAFDALTAYALKADLGRYCLLYYYGGLYSDLSNRFLNPIVVRGNRRIACFREHKPLHGAHWMVQNTIIYAAPEQEEIKLAIELVVANVRNKDYGVNSLAPSGPVLFGRVFAILNRPHIYEVGQAVNLQVEGGLNRACYVAEDGTLVAARLQGGGGKPMELGLGGTNIYGQLWDRRAIYSEGVWCFPFDHPGFSGSAERTRRGLAFAVQSAGDVILSPPASLPRGNYQAVIRFSPTGFDGQLAISIRGFDGKKSFSHSRNVVPDANGRVETGFSVVSHCDDVRIAVVSLGAAEACLQEASIEVKGRIKRNRHPFGKALALLGIPPRSAMRRNPEPQISEPQALGPDSQVKYILEFDRFCGAVPAPPLSAALKLNRDSLLKLHSAATVFRMSAEEAREFISSRFTPEIVAAFDILRPQTYKEDLTRYCWLFAQGGLFVDSAIRFVSPMCVPADRSIAFFRDPRPVGGVLWSVSPDILYSAPSQPEIQSVIEHIVANTRVRNHGYTSSSPTGAELLGRVLAASYRAESYHAGEEIPITAGLSKQNSCFVSPDGKLVAVKTHESIAASGAEGDTETVPIEEVWRSRAAYQ